MKFKLLLVAALLAMSASAYANLTITVSKNTTLGGTDWAFSGGSGTFGSTGSSEFIVGENTANPSYLTANAISNFGVYDTTLTVASGSNVFGLNAIWVREFGGIAGTHGAIDFGIDFQGLGNWNNASISTFNGLVLNLNNAKYISFNPGTYIMDSSATAFNRSIGTFTLIVEPFTNAPEPTTIALLGLGLFGFAARRRKQ
jgi:hypothetical protein